MKEKLQTARPQEVKQRKQTIESIQESISKVETALALYRTEGNKRATMSAEKVLEGLQKLLIKAKQRD